MKRPGSPRTRYQKRGSDDGVGEILRRGLDRSARDARLVEDPDVASDDV